MDTENKRITREQAAELAGVSMRTISRWSADGLISARYTGRRAVPVDYDPEEVMRVARMRTVELPADGLADTS